MRPRQEMNVKLNSDVDVAIVELEKRLEMTSFAAVDDGGPIEIGAEIGADHNGPNGKITLKWTL